MQSVYCVAHFGAARAGLSTVGYTLAGGTRVTAGVAALGGGDYGASVSVPDSGYSGPITWDTGESSPVTIRSSLNVAAAPALPAVDSSGRVTLSPAGLDAVLAEPVGASGESINGRQALALAAAGAAGVLVNVQGNHPVLMAANDPTRPRVAWLSDGYGNRLSSTVTPPA